MGELILWQKVIEQLRKDYEGGAGYWPQVYARKFVFPEDSEGLEDLKYFCHALGISRETLQWEMRQLKVGNVPLPHPRRPYRRNLLRKAAA